MGGQGEKQQGKGRARSSKTGQGEKQQGQGEKAAR